MVSMLLSNSVPEKHTIPAIMFLKVTALGEKTDGLVVIKGRRLTREKSFGSVVYKLIFVPLCMCFLW